MLFVSISALVNIGKEMSLPDLRSSVCIVWTYYCIVILNQLVHELLGQLRLLNFKV